MRRWPDMLKQLLQGLAYCHRSFNSFMRYSYSNFVQRETRQFHVHADGYPPILLSLETQQIDRMKINPTVR